VYESSKSGIFISAERPLP